MNILKVIRSWLRPPVFTGEDEKNNQASLLNMVIWGLLVIALFVAFYIPVKRNEASLSIGVILYFSALVVLLRWLMFKGRVQLACTLLIITTWVPATILLFFSGGVSSDLLLAYPALSVMAGMLISGLAGIIVALLSVLVTLLALGLSSANQLPAAIYPLSPLNIWTTFTAMIMILSALQYLSTRQIKRSLAMARRSARSEAERARQLQEMAETLEARVAERTRIAEQARLEAEAAHASVEQQMWLTTGQVKLDEILRGEHTIENLTRNGVQLLCSYLNIPAAAFFLLDSGVLRLAGGYAIDKRVPEVIRLGEGLIGQAALDKRAIALETSPNLAIKVRSILGEATPRYLLLQPILNGDVLVGVLELAMFEPLTDLQRQFLHQVESTLAAAFITAQARQRLSELLAETQHQAEELQAQEEELRAINEELQAQAEISNKIPRLRTRGE